MVEIDPLMITVCFLVGIAASMLGSMSGLGGGFIAIPTLLYLGVAPQIVVGSSKFMVLVNSLVSTFRYSRKIRLPMKLYLAVIIPMIVNAYLGAFLAAVLPSNTLMLAVGLILLAGSIKMILPSKGKASGEFENVEGGRSYVKAFLSGALAGVVAGISGLGGGIVNVPVFIYILKLNPHLAVSMSMACIAPSAVSSVVRHLIDNLINWEIAIPLSGGALIGGWVGPRIALGFKKETLKRVIGIVIAAAALRIIIATLL